MSKTLECKSCQEEWYVSDIKEGLCPNCYDYFKQLKQQVEEKDKEIEQYKSNQKAISLHSEEDFFTRCLNLQKENTILELNQKQLAIQELEKVKKQLRQDIFITAQESELKKLREYLISVDDFIDNQIKQLKEGK